MMCSKQVEVQLERSGSAVLAGGDGDFFVIVVRNVAKAQVLCPKCTHNEASWKDLALLFLLVGRGMLLILLSEMLQMLKYCALNVENDVQPTRRPAGGSGIVVPAGGNGVLL
jgi:hypothetical protein